jgi:hypothetical protein
MLHPLQHLLLAGTHSRCLVATTLRKASMAAPTGAAAAVCRGDKKRKGDTAEKDDKDGDEERDDSPEEDGEEEDEVVWLTDTSKAAAEKRAQVRCVWDG